MKNTQGKNLGAPLRPRPPVQQGIPLFTVFNIKICLDLSVLVIFSLIVYGLSTGLFPRWHPEWSPLLRWSTACVSGFLFFASLLAHELAHAVVAQRHGIPVPRITLFLFGGMAEISQEPDRPKTEFLIAIAGPLMSILIGVVCSQLAFWSVGDLTLLDGLTSGDEDAMAQLGPWQTSLLWLGSINLVLAIFNLIPGFPMDGGRVFRAIAWAITADKLKATRWASNLGRVFGWTLMVLGVTTLFQGGGHE
jgi:Zn-dependent protease